MTARPDPARRPYLGYRAGDADTEFGRFFTPDLAPLAPHVVAALALGAQSPELFAPFAEVGALLDTEAPAETGFAVCGGGEVRVHVETPMPGVTPAMWDWWFGWHGCDPRRYKLWHPRAHLWAEWADGDDAGRRGRARYVGRTSFVDEYLGSTLARAAIRFVEPAGIGLDAGALADAGRQTAVCARVGASDRPVDIGWLVHHVRADGNGSVMRSRFWLGGPHLAGRTSRPLADRALVPVARRLFRPDARAASELLVHCAQEMAHLGGFLADLFAERGAE